MLGLAVLAAVSFLSSPFAGELGTQLDPSHGEIGVIPLEGQISYRGGGFGGGGISPETVASLTERAEQDGVDALLYEINSGGGGVVASSEAARVVREADVPTVCRVKEAATSGAYWIASACDDVVASPVSLTGGIGVTTTYLEISGLLDRIGVEYVNLTSAEFKDMGTPYRDIRSEERERFNEILNTTHRYFVERIADNRDLNVTALEKSATGEIMLGRQAAERDLVDRLGGEQEAMEAARALTGKDTLERKVYTVSGELELLSDLFVSVGKGIVSGLRTSQNPGLAAKN